MSIPKRVEERLVVGLKKFKPILEAAKARDVAEADTVTIVKDILADLFGFDKYSEVTGEYAIRGTYCDLAIKSEGRLQTLIEVKAINTDLKDQHTKQAVDYAANQGVDWVILTNGICWKVYKVTFAKPINADLVVEMNLTEISPKDEQHISLLFLLCKEGVQKSVLGEYEEQRQALSKFFIGALILSDAVVDVIRREVRRAAPDVKIDVDQLRQVLQVEVLKRDIQEGDKATDAKRKVTRNANKSLRTSPSSKDEQPSTTASADSVGPGSPSQP